VLRSIWAGGIQSGAPLEEYDFRKGVRGKYAERFAEGTNLVLLDPELAKIFPDSQAVNEALRTLVRIGRRGNGPKKSGKV
jgi:hypothetical protein